MADLVVEVRQVEDGATSEGTARGHRVLIDRPVAKEGLDRGPMGGELLLLALGGCFMSNLIAAARARSLRLEGAAVTVEGELGAAPPRFTRIRLVVRGTGPDEAAFARLVQIAERGCIVHNTLGAGVALSVERAAVV